MSAKSRFSLRHIYISHSCNCQAVQHVVYTSTSQSYNFKRFLCFISKAVVSYVILYQNVVHYADIAYPHSKANRLELIMNTTPPKWLLNFTYNTYFKFEMYI